MDDGNSLIDHTGIGVSEIRTAARFYGAALAALGMRPVLHVNSRIEPCKPEDPDRSGIGYGVDYPIFWIDIFHPAGVRQHTAFRASSREAVAAFHEAALRSGGADNGRPGRRQDPFITEYYAAFAFDPDGNNIEAVFRVI
jgi:catechol 2,3-dioxygenase-like lactoylglutathione lyase family enzyme